MPLLIVLPLAAFFLFFIILASPQAGSEARSNRDGRDAFLEAAVVWGAIVTLSTEALSFFHAFTFTGIFLTWIFVLLIGVGVFYRQSWFPADVKLLVQFPANAFLVGLLFFGATILATVGWIAFLAPPNTWDSMTYHMSRIMHWIQNRSVGHYPTHILRQLYHPPWAEYAIAHFLVLTGGDRFANFIQWFSFLGSAINTSLIVRLWGFDLRSQVYTALLTLTIPMAILQASGTQNDLTFAFWLSAFLVFLFKIRLGDIGYRAIAGAGVSLGTAFLTKGLAYLYAFPFLLWFVMDLTLRRQWTPLAVRRMSLVAGSALFLNLGYYWRNFQLFGAPLGPVDSMQVTNVMTGFRVFLSNTIRNIASHLGTPSETLNHGLESIVRGIHDLLSLDIDDARTKLSSTGYYLQRMNTNEAVAGNFLHVVSSIFASIYLSLHSRLRRHALLMAHFLCLVAAFCLFSFYLKWQHWTTRLQLPLFILGAPLIGIALAHLYHKAMARGVMIAFCVASLGWVGFHYTRGLIPWGRPRGWPPSVWDAPRRAQYFFDRSAVFAASYMNATAYVAQTGCRDIGLVIQGDDWEYPLWVLLKEKTMTPFRIRHLLVNNPSKQIRREEFQAECVIATITALDETRRQRLRESYRPPQNFGLLMVFEGLKRP